MSTPADRRSARALCLAALLWAAATGAASAAKVAVEPAHLAIADCPGLPGCPALILLDETELNNESTRTKVTRRQVIKVFTQSGIDEHSTVKVRAQTGGWDVRNIAGRTILPDGSSIELKQDNIQVKHFRVGKRRERVKTVAFPGVVPGAIIEYSYDVTTEPNTYMTEMEWEIQQHLPVLAARLTLKPGKFDMAWRPGGSEKVQIQNTHPHKNVHIFNAKDVPPIPDEPYGPPDDALRARLYFDLPELQESWLGRFAGLFAGYSGRFIDGAPGIAEKVKELVAPADPPLEKVKKIYRFVQEKIGSEERRLEETEEEKAREARNAGEVLARGYGNEMERTLLFLALATEAGLETRLLLIVGRGSGVLDQNAPDTGQFDSFAASVKTGPSQWTYYDPATRHCPFGMLSPEKEGGVPNAIMIQPLKGAGELRSGVIQNLQMSLPTPVAYGVATVPFSAAARNVLTRESTVVLDQDGSAEMEVTDRGTGLVDLEHREAYEPLDDEKRREKLAESLREEIPRMELLSSSFEDIGSFDTTATLKYRLKIPGLVSGVGDRLILTPLVRYATRTNPLISDTRATAVQFDYRSRDQDTIRIQIPEGYEVAELPAPQVVRDPPFSFVHGYRQESGQVLVTRRVEIDAAAWQPPDYPRIRTFFEKLQQADRGVVILKRQAP